LSWSPLHGGHCLDPPPITSNDKFFELSRIPQWQGQWRLDIDGDVKLPLSLSLDELREYPQTEIEATLECDYATGPSLLVGNAVWSGVSLKSLIELVAPKPVANTVTFWALDGYRRGPFPLHEVLQKTDALVAYNMNGEPLPPIQGWPARIALPGHVGNNWVRWLDRIEISSNRIGDAFKQWPIHARITEPAYNAIVDKCPCTIEGMVNAGEGKEIVAVQVSTDDGATWEDAEIVTYFTPNVWKRWRHVWRPEKPGGHMIFARVIDGDGNVQEEDRPYGWRGYRVVVTVGLGVDCVDPQRADFNSDSHVDFSDFTHLADQWLEIGDGLAADLMPDDGDGQVGVRDLAFVADQWLSCFVPAAADPLPADGLEGVGLSPVLAWLPQESVIRYDVYIGTDACSVAAGTLDSEQFLGSVTDNGFAVDRVLEYDTVHYWRIDQVGPRCTASGEVWAFKTQSDSSMSSE
jgi:DMSO/TMAO reductase YedYZ molybdopterin-dependent catalytic subunit